MRGGASTRVAKTSRGKKRRRGDRDLVFLWACRLTLHSLSVPRGRVPTAFSIRVERCFSANLSATTPFHIFFSLFLFLSKKSSRLYHRLLVKSIDSLNYRERERERERERKRASIEETIIISVSGSGWHLNSQLSIVTRVNRGWWGKFNSCEVTNKVTSISCFDNLSFKI